jgi:DNA-binding NarL/FixJ family response regulator
MWHVPELTEPLRVAFGFLPGWTAFRLGCKQEEERGMAMQVAAEHSRSRIAVADLGEPRRLRVVVADESSLSMTVVLSLLEYHELVDLIGRAASFEETIQLVANHQPDLVLIDLDMPLANLVIPAMILCAHSSVKVVGMCAGETIPSQRLDMLTTVNALIHKERLSEEFATVVDALYSGAPALNAISSPRKVEQVVDRRWSGLCSQTTHQLFFQGEK